MEHDDEFGGRIAVVTGGGRGFGKAFGAALAARGAEVVLADIDRGAATEAAAEIQASGGIASPEAIDVADESQVESSTSPPPRRTAAGRRMAPRGWPCGGITMTLARELGTEGIRVNRSPPGMIFTDTIREELSPATIDGIMKQQIIGREGQEQDIVDANALPELLAIVVRDRRDAASQWRIRPHRGLTVKWT